MKGTEKQGREHRKTRGREEGKKQRTRIGAQRGGGQIENNRKQKGTKEREANKREPREHRRRKGTQKECFNGIPTFYSGVLLESHNYCHPTPQTPKNTNPTHILPTDNLPLQVLGRRAYKSSPTKLLKDTPKNEGTYSLMFPEKICIFLPLLNYYRPYSNLVGANFHQKGAQNGKKSKKHVSILRMTFFP